MTLTFYTPRLMSPEVFKSGLSPFHCGTCYTHLSHEAEKGSAFWEPVPVFQCENCGEAEGRISVTPRSAHLLDLETARVSFWYHATCVEDWYEKIQSGAGMKKYRGKFLYIHAGIEEASIDIAKDRYFKHPIPGERVMIHQLSLRPDTILAEPIVDDHETWEGFKAVTKDSRNLLQADGFRYVNRWESPGSISILVDARQLELVSSKEITNCG